MSEEAQATRVSLSVPPPQVPNIQPGDAGYVPPTDLVPLPSKGKVYPLESPLFGQETIEIRSMTARDEDILSSRALLKSGRAISSLIKSCVTNKTIDVDQLLVGDRNAVLMAIRITGYGPEYVVKVQCPSCEEEFDYTFDLGKLEIKPLGVDPVQPGQNAFAFDLPVLKKRAVFKLLTGADEREISTTIDRLKKLNGANSVENPVTARLFYSVLQIGDERDRTKLQQLVQRMPAMDSRRLRGYIDEISPGVNMQQEVECSRCGERREVEVPMGTEFFWPQS